MRRRNHWGAGALLFGLLLGVSSFGVEIAFGYGIAEGFGPQLAGVAVAAVLCVAAIAWPESILLVWFTAMLANGRWITHHDIGPLYITEIVIIFLTLGWVIRLLLHGSLEVKATSHRVVVALAVVVWVPAIVGLFVRTNTFDASTARNFALILYSIFVIITVDTVNLRASYKRWFAAVMIGASLALLIVVLGHAGPEGETSTGAIRYASHTFVLAFGIAPIVLISAARARAIPPLIGMVGSLPFLTGLIFANHRSAWVAFLAASAVLFGRDLSWPVLVGLLVAITAAAVFLVSDSSKTSATGQELVRARSVTSTRDPNARYRLSFWKAALKQSAQSPIFGNGFDPYPPEMLPVRSSDDRFAAPHNSFVAIAYRTGVIPAGLLLLMLLQLVKNGFLAAGRADEPGLRAVRTALTAIVVYVGVTSALNVFLEAPYAGPLFWASVGLLALAIHDERLGDLRKRQPVLG